MNWGKGIAIALILFIGFILYLAITLMSHKVDLESDDYYLREIAYQEEITAVENANKYDEIVVSQDETNVIVQIPGEGIYDDILVEFFRPNNNEQDKQYKVVGTKTLIINKSHLTSGQYNVEITYRNGDENCLQKSKIYI